jgi:DNA-binding response OmpR family regulator
MEIRFPPAPGQHAFRARVLLVEANRGYTGVLARRLTEAGFLVASSDSVAGALAELHRLQCDLVLAELDLPVSSGVELAQLIRADISLQDVPIVLMAGRSKRREAVRAFAAGADGVVMKPFDFDVLIARIRRELQRAQSLRDLRRDKATLDARVVKRAIELGELRDRMAHFGARPRQ